MDFDLGKARLFGWWEMPEENEREESEDVREAIETAIIPSLTLLCECPCDCELQLQGHRRSRAGARG